MATTVARLEAILGADTKGFDRGIDQSHDRFAKFSHSVKVGAGIIAGALGVGLAAALKVGVDEFKDQQLAAAQTMAVLKSTGKAAHVTAKQVDELATAISEYSGMDDEAIRSGENMLLTFTQIQNRVGKNNDIFTQATKVTADLSVAMGIDMQKAALQVGKALNDPERGYARLQRIGVAFTDSQIKAIKAMQAAGNTAGAQKVILAELTKEFGGSAKAAGETLPGKVKILHETFRNFMGDLVAKFAPALVDFAQVAVPAILNGLDRLGALIDRYVKPLVKSLAETFERNWPKIQQIAQDVFGWIKANVFPIVVNLKNIFMDMVQNITASLQQHAPELHRIFDRLGALMKVIWAVAGPALRIFFVDILPKAIGIAIVIVDKMSAAIEDVIKGFKWLYEKGRGIISDIASSKALRLMTDAFDKLATVLGKVKDVFSWILDHAKALGGVFGTIGGAASKFTGDADPNKYKNFMGGFGTGPKSIDPGLYDELGGAKAMGLVLTSGYRPGAITKHGTPSDHGVYPSKAIDVAGAPSQMARFFRWLIGQTDVKQAFYDPLGSIFGGALSSYREGGHSDHVHVATYDRGGFLQPGWNLAYNGLGVPEPVGAATGGDINLYVDGQKLFSWFRNAERRDNRRNGR